ncbi:MAG TPA: flagellin [Candidatus Baltobacteraceae bacterium]|nr:flagellin [Candidatus Baltobacteraceae bacterium]
MSDFSITNNLLANQANLNLSEHQQALAATTRALSSGLRINSAADDPSGNAIAASLQTHAQAFNTASDNVTTAQNAAAVADGALSTTTDILLRIRSLAVEASSSISSDSDRQNLQTEIDSLLIEINRISQNTTFNGTPLLDGSHAGFQAAQSQQILVTSNSVLASAGPNAAPTSPSGFLLATTHASSSSLQPLIYFRVLQNVVGSPAAQTIQVSDAAYIKPGSVTLIDGKLITVQSVNVAAGTITAVFPANIATGAVSNPFVNGSSTTAVAAGTQLMTLTGGAQPLYVGEILQVDYGSFATNDVVVVQKVMSSDSFIATFTKPHAAGAPVFNANGTFLSANFGPGNFTFSFGGAPTDGAPIGSTAYVIETNSGSFPPPDGSTTRVVATGTVVGGSVSSTTINFPTKVPDYFGGNFEVLTALGLGTTPLVNTLDGTIKLAVINTGVSIAVQETFYNTATQTASTSPYLLAPGESAMLYDGVVTTLGNFGANDVGTTAYVKTLQSTAAQTNTGDPALNVHSGADEGDTIALGIQAISTASLRISNATVLGSLAGGTDPTLAAEDTIGQTDYAIGQVLAIRAQLGAIIVRLGMESNNDAQTAINLTASQSSIVDANVGTETTLLTEQEVDVQIATSVLSQANALPEQVLKLFR